VIFGNTVPRGRGVMAHYQKQQMVIGDSRLRKYFIKIDSKSFP